MTNNETGTMKQVLHLIKWMVEKGFYDKDRMMTITKAQQQAGKELTQKEQVISMIEILEIEPLLQQLGYDLSWLNDNEPLVSEMFNPSYWRWNYGTGR